MLLARLTAGGCIDKHNDGDGSHRLVHKIQVPLLTNEKARMFVQPDWKHLEEGRACELNSLVIHGAENQGSSDRIHLIFECYNRPASEG